MDNEGFTAGGSIRKDEKVLIAVSNLGREPVKETLSMDLAKLFEKKSTGFLYKLKAFDAENRSPLKMELLPAQTACAAEIVLDIPAEDFRLIELKTEGGK